MTLTKVWLQGEIDSEPNPEVRLALERVMTKYTESPSKTSKVLKPFDKDETFKKVLKFYIDEKGYTLQQANDVAKAVVEREMQRRNLI